MPYFLTLALNNLKVHQLYTAENFTRLMLGIFQCQMRGLKESIFLLIIEVRILDITVFCSLFVTFCGYKYTYVIIIAVFHKISLKEFKTIDLLHHCRL
jgi:hypothetical protein